MASNRKDAALVRSESAQGASNPEARTVSQPVSQPQPAAAPRTGVVGELMREFTRRERLVLMLRYTEELTVAEIAAVLEIATNEVERMLESIAERVRRVLASTAGGASVCITDAMTRDVELLLHGDRAAPGREPEFARLLVDEHDPVDGPRARGERGLRWPASACRSGEAVLPASGRGARPCGAGGAVGSGAFAG